MNNAGVCSCYLSSGSGEELYISGYTRSWLRSGLSLVLTVLLAGLPVLVGRWRPRWRLWATSCQSPLREATK